MIRIAADSDVSRDEADYIEASITTGTDSTYSLSVDGVQVAFVHITRAGRDEWLHCYPGSALRVGYFVATDAAGEMHARWYPEVTDAAAAYLTAGRYGLLPSTM